MEFRSNRRPSFGRRMSHPEETVVPELGPHTRQWTVVNERFAVYRVNVPSGPPIINLVEMELSEDWHIVTVSNENREEHGPYESLEHAYEFLEEQFAALSEKPKIVADGSPIAELGGIEL